MSEGNVLDLASRRAQKQTNKLGDGHGKAEEIVACSICDNKAFTLIDNTSKEASIPGFDVICTACGTVIDLSEEVPE